MYGTCYVSCILIVLSDATRDLEDNVKNDEFAISLKHVKPKKRQREAVETLFSVDFPGSKQKFAVILDRRAQKGNYQQVEL